MSTIPPGINFIAQCLLDFLLPCSVLYPTLLIGSSQLLDLPSWASVVLSLGLRLGYYLSKPWIQELRNSRAACASGAVLPLHVRENSLEVVKELLHDLEDGYPCESFRKISEKYMSGIFRLTIGIDQIYFTTEPAHIKSILVSNFESFKKGPVSHSQFKSLLGNGVFNSDGDMWSFLIGSTGLLLDPSSPEIVSPTLTTLTDNAQHALKKAKARLAEGYSIDFQDLVARFTLDSMTEFLFNNDVYSLDAPLPYPHNSPNSPSSTKESSTCTDHPSNVFVKGLVRAQGVITKRAMIGSIWPLLEFWKDLVAADRKTLDQFVQPSLEKSLKEKKSRSVNSKDIHGTLLDCLVNKTSDQTIIKDELINLLVAGRDTTSSLLAFSCYMLIEHREMEQRLRQEILEKVGSERSPTSEDIRELKYLRAFLNEVLRLYAILPLNSRPAIVAPSPGSDVPLYIPANTTFVYSVLLMHRRTDLWGSDALEFDPDRFLDERARKYMISNSFIFCPFNAGPRICLGQQFAYNEASFFLVRLIQQFTSFSLDEAIRSPETIPKPEWVGIQGPQGRDRIRFQNSLTMFVKGGLWVKMEGV